MFTGIRSALSAQGSAGPKAAEINVSVSSKSIAKGDPFFEIHQSFQSQILEVKNARHGWMGKDTVSRSQLPLSGDYTEGMCFTGVAFATKTLERVYRFNRADLVPHCFPHINDRFGLPHGGAHGFLYIKDAQKNLHFPEPIDIWLDLTSSQFSGRDHGEKRISKVDSLYHLLKEYRGAEGAGMARDLFLKGYVTIPHNERGEQRLKALVMAYIRACTRAEGPTKEFSRETLRESPSFLYPIERMDSEVATYRNSGELPFEYDLHNPAFRIEYSGTKDRNALASIRTPGRTGRFQGT